MQKGGIMVHDKRKWAKGKRKLLSFYLGYLHFRFVYGIWVGKLGMESQLCIWGQRLIS